MIQRERRAILQRTGETSVDFEGVNAVLLIAVEFELASIEALRR